MSGRDFPEKGKAVDTCIGYEVEELRGFIRALVVDFGCQALRQIFAEALYKEDAITKEQYEALQ